MSTLPDSQGGAAARAPEIEKYDVDEHTLGISEVAEKYAVHVDTSAIARSGGLSSAEAAKRLARDGPNALTPAKTLPEWAKYLLQYTNPLLLLLITSGVLSFVAYALQGVKDLANIYCGSVLVGLVIVLATKTYLSERAATKVATSLRNMLPSVTLVVRDGEESQINAADLVVGDIVHMVIGTRVPADLKVIESRDLKLDFSSLTGESDPIPMSTEAKDPRVHESHNIAFMSSQVLNGEGRGIVVRVGDGTFIGKINTLTAGTKQQETTLVVDIRRLVTFIAVGASVFAIVLFGVGIGRGIPFADAFVNAFVVVVVAFVPTGLPAMVAAMLGTTIVKMKAQRVVAKKADILDALGAASRIASDKTGTLTQNSMTVVNCWVNCQFKSTHDILAMAPHFRVGRMSRTSSRTATFARRSIDRLSAAWTGLSRRTSTDASGSSPLDHSAADSKRPETLVEGVELTRMSPPNLKSLSTARFGTDHLSRMAMGQSTSLSGADAAGGNSKTFAVNLGTSPSVAAEAGQTIFATFSPFAQLLTIAACNNKAQFAATDPSQAVIHPRKVLGDATDSGLLRFCDELVDVDATRTAFAPVYVIPFNSRNKWALTVVSMPGDSTHYLAMLKGAPEYVAERCTKFQYRGKEVEFDDDLHDDMLDAYESFGIMAERVIGHAFKLLPRTDLPTIPTSQADAEAAGLLDGFTFAGLLSLIDPPREAVPPAVETCRAAGVAVTMITGDHPLTAEAIARKCHIVTTPTRREVAAEYGVEEDAVDMADPNMQALVITGAMIEDIVTDEEWDAVMDKDELVFARTTPQQKLLIVGHFQRRGDVVAVTGDGVNDAPALRRADIGVAMGNPDSSEVAREAADIVLLDDDFAALVYAIAEGRCLYDNLKKVAAYTLVHASPEFTAVFMNLALGMPLGLGAMLVLTIDLITEQTTGNSLAFEPPEANLMARAPRNPRRERLVSLPLMLYAYVIVGSAEALACVGAYLWTFRLNGVPASAIFLLNPKDGVWQIRAESIERDVTVRGRVYDAEEQANIVGQANSAWYITLIMCQFWHVWFCKTRRISIFSHPIFENTITVYGVIAAVAIMTTCAYVPALQDNVFYNATPPGLAAWIPNLFFLAFVATYSETCKYCARRWPNGFVATYIAF